MNRPKICFLLFNLNPGGLENYLLRFIKQCNHQFEAVLITKSGKTGQLLNQFIQNQVRIVPIKGGYFNIIGWYRYYTFFKKNQFLSVCDLTGNFSGVYMFLSKMAGVKNRIAYYGQSTNHFKETLPNIGYNAFVNRLVFSFSTLIISNSNTAFQFFFGSRWKGNKKFVKLSNGVDEKYFAKGKLSHIKAQFNIPNNALVVGHSARLDVKKNHKAVLALAKRMIALHSRFYFLLWGNETEKLSHEVVNQHLQNHVFILGYKSDVAEVLQNCDFFYFPSYTEGQPNVLIECMLACIPFVASNIEPIKEIVPIEFRNRLVDPDDIDSAINLLLDFANRNMEKENEQLLNYALREFNAQDRFQDFYRLITGNTKLMYGIK